jgi:hypothetical protein
MNESVANYSSTIDMWMDCGPHGTIPLAQISATFIISALPVELPACSARLVLIVDGKVLERRVRLVNGMHGTEAMICSDDDIAPF